MSSGTYTPLLVSGGDSISLSQAYWYKMGNLVQICILTWGSEIINPNDDNVLISLPFRPISNRNYGQTGFNSSGIEFYPAIAAGFNALHFFKRVQGGEVLLTGKNFPNTTFQCSIQYFTDD